MSGFEAKELPGLEDKALVQQYLSFVRYPAVVKQVVDDLLDIVEGQKSFQIRIKDRKASGYQSQVVFDSEEAQRERRETAVIYISRALASLRLFVIARMTEIAAAERDVKDHVRKLKTDWLSRVQEFEKWQDGREKNSTGPQEHKGHQSQGGVEAKETWKVWREVWKNALTVQGSVPQIVAAELAEEMCLLLKEVFITLNLSDLQAIQTYISIVGIRKVEIELADRKMELADPLEDFKKISYTVEDKKALRLIRKAMERLYDIQQLDRALDEAISQMEMEQKKQSPIKRGLLDKLLSPALEVPRSSPKRKQVYRGLSLTISPRVRQGSTTLYDESTSRMMNSLSSQASLREEGSPEPTPAPTPAATPAPSPPSTPKVGVEGLLLQAPAPDPQPEPVPLLPSFSVQEEDPSSASGSSWFLPHIHWINAMMRGLIGTAFYVGFLAALGVLQFLGISWGAGLILLGVAVILCCLLMGINLYERQNVSQGPAADGLTDIPEQSEGVSLPVLQAQLNLPHASKPKVLVEVTGSKIKAKVEEDKETTRLRRHLQRLEKRLKEVEPQRLQQDPFLRSLALQRRASQPAPYIPWQATPKRKAVKSPNSAPKRTKQKPEPTLPSSAFITARCTTPTPVSAKSVGSDWSPVSLPAASSPEPFTRFPFLAQLSKRTAAFANSASTLVAGPHRLRLSSSVRNLSTHLSPDIGAKSVSSPFRSPGSVEAVSSRGQASPLSPSGN